MKMFYRLKLLFVALIIAAAGLIPAAANGNGAKQNIEKIISYNLQSTSAESVQEWVDGGLTRDAGAGSEWYVIALSKHGSYDFSAYTAALNGYLSENEIGSASSRLKYALAFIAAGDDNNPYIGEALGNSIGEQGIMSLVFGLHLLNNGCKSNAYPVNGLLAELLSLQHADGGWSVTGEYGDVDVTAMTVQALAFHYSDNEQVGDSVDRALEFLSARQLESGGYSAYGVENPESSAQVIIALSSLGIDVCNDDRFIKNDRTVFDGINKFSLPDGSFCHKEENASDSTATAQVFCASVAYESMKKGGLPFYVFDGKASVESTAAASTEAFSSEAASVNAALTGITVAEETTRFVENKPEAAEAATACETAQAATRAAATNETGGFSFALIIGCICIVSAMICAVLFVTGRRKYAVFVIAAAIAVGGFFAVISDNAEEHVGSVTVSISCRLIRNEDKSFIPENGVILEKTVAEIENDDTVYDVLSEVCRENGIILSSNMGYIEGINNIFETDFGEESGWMYFVNGEAPSVGCGSCKVKDGDCIEWHYTLETGRDLDIDFEK